MASCDPRRKTARSKRVFTLISGTAPLRLFDGINAIPDVARIFALEMQAAENDCVNWRMKSVFTDS